MIDKVKILVSRDEPFTNGAEAIAETCQMYGLNAEILYLENIVIRKPQFPNFSCVYLLTNSFLNRLIVYNLLQTGSVVINWKYYHHNLNKLLVQFLLSHAGILIPDFFFARGLSFVGNIISAENPMLLKSVFHTEQSHFISSQQEFRHTLSSHKHPFHYLERFIKGVREYKVYAIGPSIIERAADVRPKETLFALVSQVRKVIDIEVCSVDILEDIDGNLFIIDVNPAPACYNSFVARCKLVEYIIAAAKIS